MQVKIPSYYKKFKCIAGKCSDTCCDGWRIIIDDKSVKKYREHSGVLKERFQERLVSYNGESIFVPDGSRCPFLNSKNTCDIYICMGEDALSSTCSDYPRKISVKGNVMEAFLNLSCPEAARLMLSEKDGIKFEKYDDGVQTKTVVSDRDIFMDMLEEVFINIVNEKRIPWKKRLVMILFAADNICSSTDKDFDVCMEFVMSLKNQNGIMELSELIPDSVLIENTEIKKQILSALLNVYGAICIGRNHDSMSVDLMQEYLENENTGFTDNEDILGGYNYQYENYVTYFIFRHLKECVTGRDIFEMAVMMCVSYSIIKAMDVMCIRRYGELSLENQVEIMHYYSKIVEHSDKDYNRIMDIIRDCGFDTMAYMVQLT
ncbi:MAG: flagellin lysine-N-methylase [Lachnospiraceae bacterium]|nr:flagellin lysine-N-methylase [Lachnospiraceae bacterium]